MCPVVDTASKNEYQVNPGGKGGRCVRLKTYHLHVPMSRNLGTLTSWNPVGLFRPVMGQLFYLINGTIFEKKIIEKNMCFYFPHKFWPLVPEFAGSNPAEAV
jgi:hypothetical protein